MTRRLAPADGRVLHMLADAADRPIALPDVHAVRREIDRLGPWAGERATAQSADTVQLPRPAAGEAVLAGHRLLLDQGRLQDGDEALAGTRHEASARLSAATAAETGVKTGDVLAVTGPTGSVELPLRITEMPDRVVWLPMNSTGAGVLADTGARPGTLVRIGPATPAAADDTTAEVGA